MEFSALLIVRLLDPVGGIIAFLAGWLIGRWWAVVLGAAAGVTAVELVLSGSQPGRQLVPATIAAGALANAAHAVLGIVLRRLVDRRRAGKG